MPETGEWANRAKAVQAYANLEQALCRLFALLCGISLDAAGIIFFKITNSQARNDILAQLFKWRFKSEFNLFQNSLFKTLRPIDIKRNEIIHWNTICETHIDDSGMPIHELFLRPPTSWVILSEHPQINDADLNEFYNKCRFYTKVIGMFDAISRGNAGPMTVDELNTWNEIFQSPIVYPPQEGTPLFQILAIL
jgi:hypothetical protein